MQKGTMMTAIVDGVVRLTNAFANTTKKAKETGLTTDQENAYIARVFSERIKEGNQYIEKIKELLSPKHASREEEKIKSLEKMHGVIKGYVSNANKFEKGFDKLLNERASRLTDTQEIARLFKTKGLHKESSEN